MRRLTKKVPTALESPRRRYPNVEPKAKFRMSWPAEEMRERTMRTPKRKMICLLTILSSAVLLMGAAVAFRISFVSCPVKTTMP